MCLIVECNKDIPLTKEFITHVMEKNDDGYGMMWVNGNRIDTFKSHTSNPAEAFKEYNKIKEYPAFMHFRMKTHGAIDHENTHPYNCGFGIHLMHNGILSNQNHYMQDQSKSDTWHFINSTLRSLLALARNPHEMIRSKSFIELIEHNIGFSNKFVMGDSKGFVIYNPGSWFKIENEWTKVKGLLVSNRYAWNENSFKDPEVVKQEKKQAKKHHQHQNNGVQYNWFKKQGWGLEEYDERFSLDKCNNVWEKIKKGWKCRFDLSFHDLVENTRKEAAERELKKVDNQVTELYHYMDKVPMTDDLFAIPAVVPTLPPPYLPPPPLPVVIPEVVQKDSYEEQLIREWSKYKPHEINTLVYSEPDEASTILAKLLKDWNPKTYHVY